MKMPIKDNEECSVQMAPMIDMVFLLLIFFMCASHMATQTNVKLDIPWATKAVIPKDRPDRWVVNILKDGSILEGNSPVSDIELLKKSVMAKVKETPDLKVYLRADKDSPHKEVKKVMAAMAEAGVADFIFGVYIPPDAIPEVAQ